VTIICMITPVITWLLMTDLEKLEFIHSAIQEALDPVSALDTEMLEDALRLTEDVRENEVNRVHSE